MGNDEGYAPHGDGDSGVPSDAHLARMENTAHERSHRFRAWLHRRHPVVRVSYRVLIAVLGALVITIGLILVPLPGPGWLIVFGGLAILATEFAWARRVARWLKRQLDRFWAWWKARRARKHAEKAARRAAEPA